MANRYFSGPTLQPAKMDLAGPLLQGLALAQRQKEMEENKRQFAIGQLAAAEAAKAKAEHDQMKFDLDVAKFNADLPLKDAQLRETTLRGDKLTDEQEETRRQRQIVKQKQFLNASAPLTHMARAHAGAQSPFAKKTLEENFAKTYAQVRDGLTSQGVATDLPDEVPIDQWTQLVDGVNSNLAGTMNQNDFDRTAAAHMVVAKLAAQGISAPIDAQLLAATRGDMMQEALDIIQSQKRDVAKDSAPRIDARHMPLNTAPESKVQDKLVYGEEALGAIASIKSLAQPKFFDLMGRAKALGAKGAAYIDDSLVQGERRDDLQTRRKLYDKVERLFSAHRRFVTGAAAPMAELEELRKQYLNMDLPWVEFEASLEGLTDDITREMRIHRRLLREGLDVSEIDSARATLMRSGETASGQADQLARAKELERSGMAPVDVVQTLLFEGYFTWEQAESAYNSLGQ